MKIIKKKAFSLIELLAMIFILGLLLLIVIPTIQKYINGGKKSYYTGIEGEMKTAGMDYLESYRSLLPKEINNIVVVPLSELVANKYIDDVKDENGNACTGQVAVKRIKNSNYEYYSCLQCGENGKLYSTNKKVKTANGEEVSVCTVDDTKNVYSDSGDYRVEAPCGSLGTCDAKTCTDPKTCTNPDPAICTGGYCPINLNPSTRTLTVYQGKGSIKVPYGKVYYKNNPEPIKDDLMGSPSLVDISKLGITTVTYSYRGQIAKIYVNVVDATSPETPSIALRKDSIFGTTYDKEERPWYSGNVFATFRSTDYAGTGILGSGIKEYRVYPIVESEVNVPINTLPFEALSTPWETVTREGDYTRYVIAVDKNGNESGISSYSYRIDKTKPFDPTYRVIGSIKDGWYKADTTVVIYNNGDNLQTGVNRCSDVKKVSYTINNGNNSVKGPYNFTSSTKEIVISEDGVTTVEAYAIDNANNASNTTSVSVKVDQTAPNKPTLSPDASAKGNNGWYVKDVVVKVNHNGDNCRTGVECSGYEYMTYEIKGAQGSTAIQSSNGIIDNNGTLTISAEGKSTITVNVFDLAGNVNSQTIEIKLDKTAPSAPTYAVASGVTASAYGWYNRDIPITISAANDPNTGLFDVSGTAGIKYKITGAQNLGITTENKMSKSVTISTDGTSTITAYVYDNAGNITAVPSTYTVNRDTVKPGCAMTNAGTAYARSKTLTYKCKESGGSGCVSEDGSGACSFYYNSTTGTVRIDGSSCVVTDKANNTNTCPTDSYAVNVDTNPPTCTVTKSNTGTTSGVNTTVTCSDTGGSGCNAVSGDTGLKIGKTYTVIDKAGNSNTCSVTVTSETQYRQRTCAACNTKCTKTEKECIDGWYYQKCSCDGSIIEWDPPSAGHNYATTPSPSTCACADGSTGTVTVTDIKGCNEYRDKCVETTPDCSLGCATWSNYGQWSTRNKCGGGLCQDQSRVVYN